MFFINRNCQKTCIYICGQRQGNLQVGITFFRESWIERLQFGAAAAGQRTSSTSPYVEKMGIVAVACLSVLLQLLHVEGKLPINLLCSSQYVAKSISLHVT